MPPTNNLTSGNTLSAIVLSNPGPGWSGTTYYNTSILFSVGSGVNDKYGGSIGGGLLNNVGSFVTIGTMFYNSAIYPLITMVSSNSSSGNVGINTSTPGYQLDVSGTARVTGITILGSNLNMCNNNISNIGTLTASNITAVNSTAGSPLLTLSNTTAGASGSNGPRISLIAQGGSGNIVGIDFKPWNGMTYGGATINGVDDGAQGAHMTFLTQTGNVAPLERMRITSGGLMGINCNAPAYTLDVVGTSRISSNLGVGVTPLGTAGSINVSEGFYINGVKQLGPTGPTGTQGTQGPTGTQGTQGTQGPTGTQGTQGPTGTQGTQGTQGPTGTQGNAGVGTQGPTGPAGSGGGGSSSVSITGSTGFWSVLTVATGGTGLFGNSNLTFNASNMLTVTGALTVANGFRPNYQKITTGTSITPASSSYGTHYDINTTALTGLTISYPVAGSNNWSNDSNGYWVFRNNTGSYLSLAVTYTAATPNIYPSNVTIPPGNSVTLMASYPGGGTNSNYVLF